MTSAGNVRFGAAGWSAVMPQILIFDSTFVAENVHAGDVVELEQKRNLYSVIIGQDGIGLAAEDRAWPPKAGRKATAITAAEQGPADPSSGRHEAGGVPEAADRRGH